MEQLWKEEAHRPMHKVSKFVLEGHLATHLKSFEKIGTCTSEEADYSSAQIIAPPRSWSYSETRWLRLPIFLSSLRTTSGHEFEQTLGISGGQGSLACCSPWACKESDTTEQQNNKEGEAAVWKGKITGNLGPSYLWLTALEAGHWLS